MRPVSLIAVLLFAAACIYVSEIGASSKADLLFRALLLVMLALSWNLMANAGLISLGHSAFWGIGGYTAILASNWMAISFPVTVALALIFGAATGAMIATITGRLKGIYFAISTLALSEGIRVLALMMPDLTGGATGLYAAEELRPSTFVLHCGAVAAVSMTVLTILVLDSTRLRFAVRAMRSNEDAAQMLGINPRRYRILISLLAGGMAATAGALNGWYTGYISPDVAFELHYSILAQIATILGGIYTLIGPIVGSAVLLALNEVTRASFTNAEGVSQLIYGLIIIIVVSLLPRGIYGIARARLIHWKRRRAGGL